jgi:hypothetical protein
MATNQIKKKLRKEQNRTFTARDFESLRAQLLETARTYFPDKIQDFSEASVGGMFLDFAATVGDSLSFYLDHSFRELDPTRAVEPDNIITHLRNAGVDIVGAAPASVTLKFSFTAPAEFVSSKRSYLPKRSAMPVILAGTSVTSFSGITFNTVDDLDFAEQDDNGDFLADFVIASTDANGAPETFTVTREVASVSGQESTETITIPDTFVPFRELTLGEKSITAILSVTDSESNTYYEVDSLSDDTVFVKTRNPSSDANQVQSYMQVQAAPYRFITQYDPTTQLTTVRFGSGNADTLDDDIVPDPSELSLNLFGKPVVRRFNIDPQSLLETQTLGISPRGTTLTIRYRHGGGLEHNVPSNSVETIETLSIAFRRSPNASDALTVRQSVSVTNDAPARGGDTAPDLTELQTRITSARKAQRRVVSREDLLARIYTLPSEFGRVYRADIVDNPVNPNSALLYLLSRNSDGTLGVSPDTLKKNISTYLNGLRLMGDAMDILDAKIINFGVKYSVLVSSNANKAQVITTINTAIAAAFDRKFISIGQPIIIDDITNIIINTDFVISLSALKVFPRIGTIEDRSYSSTTFDFEQSKTTGVIIPDRGSIFELKFSEFDIIGTAA